jgi:uncharacterized OB-fold protein
VSEKQLTALKCVKCGKIAYPLRRVCLNCKGRDFTPVDIVGEGMVLTFTHLYAPPEGIEQKPLTLGIVQFKNGVKVVGQIESREVKTGDNVLPVWGLLRKKGENEIYGFKFKKKE